MFESIYDVMQCVPKKFRKLPSARRIFPKVFRRSHFWTSNSCPFPGKFFESCANSFRNITNLFMYNSCIYESIMVTIKSE